MKKILITVLFSFLFLDVSFASVISGKINHDDINFKNKIIDAQTQKPLTGAKITIPELNYSTFSDNQGCFKLKANVTNSTVMFVEKDGYKTFSLTVNDSVLNSPLKIGIEKSSPFDFQVTSGVVHLGDNMFSTNSANSTDFRLGANGYYFSYVFNKPKFQSNQNVIVKIGTIIGIDTKKAKELGQNKIAKVYSSPTEVIINGHKIGTIELNGDNIEVQIPKILLKEKNELIIKTGKNLFQFDYVDYDDIELANVRIEVKNNQYYAKN